MSTILSVGEDVSLLYIREMVLAASGASVTTVKPSKALLLLSEAAFDLVVFCHSVRECDLQRIYAASRACAYPPKTLLLEIPGLALGPRVAMDRRHSLEQGPGRLVQEIRDLLGCAEPAAANAKAFSQRL